MKARDGVTDLHGLLFKPSHFDATRRYPIVNEIYPGPQVGSVNLWSDKQQWKFAPSRGDAQSLAELGFIVVAIDGMGTELRSRKFHDTYYGDMGDNTLPDQVAGMTELSHRYTWIDLERAGIYGHSGGGFAAAAAMLRYPDFFKVGISESGNHDQTGYTDDWGEKFQGLLQRRPDGTSNYDSQANQNLATNLKGHLLLAHGTLDENVPPESHVAPRRCVDQRQQKFRSDHAAESASRIHRPGADLDDSPALGLFRSLSAGRATAWL